MKITVDACGMSCPVPVIKTKAALDSNDWDQVEVLLDEEVAKENVTRLAGSFGCVVETVAADGEFKLTIRKGEDDA